MKFTRNALKFGAALLATASATAHAALPAGVTSAIEGATADGVALGGAFLGMAVTVGVLFWLKRKAG
jgi:hypothetical protein